MTRTRLYRALLRRLSPDLVVVASQPVSSNRFAHVPLGGEVVVYFSDDTSKLYQLDQWLPVIEKLHERHPVLIVTRNLGSFRKLQDEVRLPTVYARRLRDLNEVLDNTCARACLYVNNSATNFQVLGWPRALHLHLNHGESDKISMATNHAKIYDYVLVAGPAARRRYVDNLLAFDDSKLVEVGRPQLDLTFAPMLPVSTRVTVLYAPTWEGETPAMNYTSLVAYGEQLVDSLVADGGCRVVYKPHPKLRTGSRAVAATHAEICRRLEEANVGLLPEDRHVVEMERPILGLFPTCDVLVSDVSSVALDWLYLRNEAPLWIADPRNDRAALVKASPLTSQTYILDGAVMPDVAAAVHKSLTNDELSDERRAARQFYFGDLQPGESTDRFLAVVEDAIQRCSGMLAERQGEQHDFELPAAVS